MISGGFAGLPPHGARQRIGLFGGSFNPPHDGHRRVSLLALRRLELDWVWWLVTPGNPLKDTSALPPMAARIEAARRIASHPRIAITGVEARLGSPYTCDLVTAVTRRNRATRFVWIMGADSFANFHLWKRWRLIADTLPLAIIDRPGFTLRAGETRAARALQDGRIDEKNAARLATIIPPAYVFLHGPRSALSSTQLRADGTSGGADGATTSP